MKVPLVDLQATFKAEEEEVKAAVEGVLASGYYVLGPQVAALEKEIASYCDTEYGIGVNSGTDALLIALKALNVGPGDEVVVPAFTIIVDAAVVEWAGARPVFVDVDPRTLNLDANLLERAITSKTKAVIVVHLYGQPAAMDDVMRICNAHGIPVVEDAAQAIGAEYRGRKAGNIGRVGCISFYPTKNLGACGDGGMIVTNDEGIAKRSRLYRHHGDDGSYHNVVVGLNSRLDEVQAAILRVRAKRLNWFNERRRELAHHYDKGLAGLPGIQLPVALPECRHVYHLYNIRAQRRDELKEFLAERGIGTRICYPLPLHQQPCLLKYGLAPEAFPVSLQASREVLALPLYPELEMKQVDFVVESMREFVKTRLSRAR